MKLLIIGTGSIGMQYVSLIRQLSVEPILFSVRTERRVELASQGYSVAQELNEVDADYCIIATETHRHVDDTIWAVGAGMKVLVEKPLGINSEDVMRLEGNLTEEQLNAIRIVSPLRWYDGIQKVQKNLAKLGRVHTVNIWCQSYLPDWRERDYRESYSADVTQGGVVRDLVHEIDYCNALFTLASPDELNCVAVRGCVIDIASSANVHLSWLGSSNELITIQLDYLTRKPRRGISVFGEFGECHADLISGEYSELIEDVLDGEMLENKRDVAMMEMLNSFLNQDGLGCDYQGAKEAAKLIDFCESKLNKS